MTLKDVYEESTLRLKLSYQSAFCRIYVGFIITTIAPTLTKSSRNLKVNFVSSEVTLRNLFITTHGHSVVSWFIRAEYHVTLPDVSLTEFNEWALPMVRNGWNSCLYGLADAQLENYQVA